MHHLLSCCICQSKKDKEKKKSCTRDGENTVQSAQPENNVRQDEAAAPQQRGAVAPHPRNSNARLESGVRSRHGSTKSRQGDKTPSQNTDVETGPPADYQVSLYLRQFFGRSSKGLGLGTSLVVWCFQIFEMHLSKCHLGSLR